MLEGLFGGGYDLEQELRSAMRQDQSNTGMWMKFLGEEIKRLEDRVRTLEQKVNQQTTAGSKK